LRHMRSNSGRPLLASNREARKLNIGSPLTNHSRTLLTAWSAMFAKDFSRP
jgi:hypothetical protein